jgi:hypothetical protein
MRAWLRVGRIYMWDGCSAANLYGSFARSVAASAVKTRIGLTAV